MQIKNINGNFKGKHVVSLEQFDRKSIEILFKKTKQIIKFDKKRKILHYLKGKIATLLFFEPSSRTFSSFCTAVKKSGGQTIEYQNPLQTSSAVKGETLEDTINVFENYADIIVIRHPQIGAVKRAIEASIKTPIINAGDGSGEHPTQALMDLFTIKNHFKKLDGITGLMTGDLLYGRTVHSLIKGLSLFNNVTIYLLSPPKLKLAKDVFDYACQKGVKLIEIDNEKGIPKNCNFWYWTRVQKERFSNLKEYEKLKHSFILTNKLLTEKGNQQMIVMHPLPRVGEIETEIDDDPRALYLTEQIKNGLYVRMALISLIFGK